MDYCFSPHMRYTRVVTIQINHTMKKCKSCQSEIDVKATKCPHCQADQRGWFRKHPILTVIFVVVAIGIFGSASGSNSGNKSQTQKVGENNTAKVVETVVEKEKVGDYQIGDKIKMGNVILTVNKMEKSQGGGYTKPSEGNQWIDLNMTIENTGSNQEYVTTLGQMFILDDQNNQYQIAVTAKRLENPSIGLDGAIIAKAKKTDWVGFEVPKTSTGLKFQYNTNLFTGGKIVVDLGI